MEQRRAESSRGRRAQREKERERVSNKVDKGSGRSKKGGKTKAIG